MDLAYIPSPADNAYHLLGFIPLRGYAFCIIIGIFVAVWLGNRRWVARGGRKGTIADITVWAVPFGLVGGRLYHVVTSYEPYFGKDGNPVDALKVWEGGLGIWGAIALGALGAWIGCRRRGIPLPAFADAVAPGVAFAQAIGRWGNWFNQELYGRPTDLPWAVEIAEKYRPTESLDVATYHPTFLYESLWCVGVGLLVIWADRRFRLGHGRAFALYVAAYTAGRFWIEYLRIDDAHHVLGLRLNNWTSIVVFVAAVVCLAVSARIRPGREVVVEPAAPTPADEPTEAADAEAPRDAEPGEDAESGGPADADGSAGPAPAGDARPGAESGAGADDAGAGEPADPAEATAGKPRLAKEPHTGGRPGSADGRGDDGNSRGGDGAVGGEEAPEGASEDTAPDTPEKAEPAEATPSGKTS